MAIGLRLKQGHINSLTKSCRLLSKAESLQENMTKVHDETHRICPETADDRQGTVPANHSRCCSPHSGSWMGIPNEKQFVRSSRVDYTLRTTKLA